MELSVKVPALIPCSTTRGKNVERLNKEKRYKLIQKHLMKTLTSMTKTMKKIKSSLKTL